MPMPVRKVTRREFLKGAAASAALVALPTIVPASVFGAGNQPVPSNRITMACVGLGGMGGGNMGSFLGQGDCRILAICDVDKGHAEGGKNAVNGRYGNKDCKTYGDFREVMARDDIDTIMLATPDHWHSLVGIAAAKSGKDVYGEKPFTHDLREGRAMADAMKQYGRVWQTGSWQRSTGDFRFACELVRNGRIGKVHTVEVGLPTGGPGGSEKFCAPPPDLDYDMWVGPSPWAPYSPDRTHWNWRWHLDYGGGQLMDWIGDKGWVWVDRGGFDANPKSLLKETIRPDEINLYRSPGHHRNFLDCVKSRKLTITPAEVAHRSASLGHLCLVTLKVGRKIRFDPVKEEILGDPAANALLGRTLREPWQI
jgi:hypothetical protein